MKLLKHKDKREEYTYYLKDGIRIRHGLCRGIYSNGQPQSECAYKDGRQYGLQRGWYENSQLEFEWTHIEEGGFNGLHRTWLEDGRLVSEHNYKDGQIHGPCRDWDAEKQIEKSYYWEGVEHSEEKYNKLKETEEELLLANRSW